MFRFIAEELSCGRRLVVATVVSRSGSGPREPGAMMVLPEDGPARGTVGGGPLEAKTQAMAKASLIDGRPRFLSFDLSSPDVTDSEMICGGHVEILVDCLDGGNPEQVRIFKKLSESLAAGIRMRLLTSIIVGEGEGATTTGRGLSTGDDLDLAGLDECFQNAGQIGQAMQTNVPVLLHAGDARCFIQPIDPPKRIYIAGAGHVGLALAAICSIAGFRTIVIDDRALYANRDRFPAVDEIRLIAAYANALDGAAIAASDAVLIATHSHRADRDVLAAALMTRAGYIGMIASRRKRDIIYASLRNQGFTKEELLRIHSPAGLDIGAETPAEIAVSITAELIALDNRKG